MEQEATGRLATARLAMPNDVDDGVAREADALEIFGALSAPMATIGHLVALKRLARDDYSRSQDHADLRSIWCASRARPLSTTRDARSPSSRTAASIAGGAWPTSSAWLAEGLGRP